MYLLTDGEHYDLGVSANAAPTSKNGALKLPTFAVIVGVSPTKLQWKSLALEETTFVIMVNLHAR